MKWFQRDYFGDYIRSLPTVEYMANDCFKEPSSLNSTSNNAQQIFASQLLELATPKWELHAINVTHGYDASHYTTEISEATSAIVDELYVEVDYIDNDSTMICDGSETHSFLTTGYDILSKFALQLEQV